MRQAKKLGRRVDELLDISRLAGDRLVLEAQEFDLGVLVCESVADCDELSRRAGSTITMSRDPACAGLWDRRRLGQVIDNLLSNALKYGGGKPVEIEVRAAPGAVTLSVRDHGIGIAPEDQRRIFERFERAVSSQRYGGLGLGLWIARQIVPGPPRPHPRRERRRRRHVLRRRAAAPPAAAHGAAPLELEPGTTMS